MPETRCETCGSDTIWNSEEAFDKFGFNDGDGQVMTGVVAKTLTLAGYAVTAERWGRHNVVITSIRNQGHELIPESTRIGYDNPREYLPAMIVALLDQHLGDEEVLP